MQRRTKEMPYKDKEKKREHDRKYYQTHKKQKNEYSRKYHWTHREELNKKKQEYNRTHRKQMQEYCRTHKKERAEYNKYWKEKNPEKRREIVKRHRNKRRRNLGFNPLNKPFEECEAHHINFNDVIYIPKSLHQSIPHNLSTGKNMALINSIAYQFLMGNYVVYK